MAPLDLLKGCELHIHSGGGLYAEDLLELGKDIYKEIDWELFVKGFEETFGVRPDPIVLYEEALHGGESGRQRFQHHYVYGHADAGDFSIHASALEREWEQLQHRLPDDPVTRPYSPERLDQVRRRQDYVLDCLTVLGTVIETCPTSNLRIGGVPSPARHPIHRFLRSEVNLAIGADDPGIFNSPLSAEVDWVLDQTHHSAGELVDRLGDPRRFRLGALRPGAG